MISPIRTLEESQLQPSPSKKAAIEEVNNKITPPVKNLSDTSPKVAGKKPVLPPSNSKQKLDVMGGINKEQSSPSLNKTAPPPPPPKFYKEAEHSGADEVKDSISPPVKESKNEAMDTTDGSVPISLPTTITPPLTKPKPSKEEENKSVDTADGSLPTSSQVTPTNNVPLIKPKPLKEEEIKSVNVTNNGLPTSPPATPTDNISLTKPKPLEEPAKESPDTNGTDTLTSSLASDHPSTKPKPSNVKELDTTDGNVTASLSATPTDNELPTKEAKSPDTTENNIPTSLTTTVPTANRPFARPKPPAKHPKPRSTSSRNLGLLEEAKDKVSPKNLTTKETERNTKPTGGISEQAKAEEMEKTTEHIETSKENPTMKEPIEKATTKDQTVMEEVKDEKVVMGETSLATDKVSVEKLPIVNKPKPKPRASKFNLVPETPLANLAVGDSIKKNTVGENNNENVEQKSDAEIAKETENSASIKIVETKENVSDKLSDVDENKVINKDEDVDTVASAEGKATIIDDADALYSVVNLNRNSEERESSHNGSAQKSRETTPKYHEYDFVTISPRSVSKTPEQEDPGYDVIGDVTKEPVSTKELVYDNWKLKKHPNASSSKVENASDTEAEYAVIEEVQNHPASDVLPVPLNVATSSIPQYAQICKDTKTQESEGSLHIDGSTTDDNYFDALFEHLGSNIPAHLNQAKEILRLAQVVRQEAEQLKKEAAEDREAAKRERIEAEQIKKEAEEILKMAKEKVSS